jgi:hypothetical protein
LNISVPKAVQRYDNLLRYANLAGGGVVMQVWAIEEKGAAFQSSVSFFFGLL